MQRIIPEKLLRLARSCPRPLYVVGGSVRDFLAGLTRETSDWDICSPMSTEELVSAAEACGLCAEAVYKNTGTVKLKGDGIDYEYTCFRSDKYVRGTHVPAEIFFTEDISLDAKRRDFTANAVYYDIAADKFLDPLGGRADIEQKRLKTVDDAGKVFGEDGLRLMRLARQAGQLGFTPTGGVYRRCGGKRLPHLGHLSRTDMGGAERHSPRGQKIRQPQGTLRGAENPR